jgi:hypothetical protein
MAEHHCKFLIGVSGLYARRVISFTPLLCYENPFSEKAGLRLPQEPVDLRTSGLVGAGF